MREAILAIIKEDVHKLQSQKKYLNYLDKDLKNHDNYQYLCKTTLQIIDGLEKKLEQYRNRKFIDIIADADQAIKAMRFPYFRNLDQFAIVKEIEWIDDSTVIHIHTDFPGVINDDGAGLENKKMREILGAP